MPRGGRLKITTRAAGSQVILIVEDTGIGMEQEVLDKIFTPFFTTKDIHEGTGLGLPVVHGIITSHGGTIDVRSSLGKGTRFEIRLPAANAEEDKESLGNDNEIAS
jgi:signal transduction histidine kinase